MTEHRRGDLDKHLLSRRRIREKWLAICTSLSTRYPPSFDVHQPLRRVQYHIHHTIICRRPLRSFILNLAPYSSRRRLGRGNCCHKFRRVSSKISLEFNGVRRPYVYARRFKCVSQAPPDLAFMHLRGYSQRRLLRRQDEPNLGWPLWTLSCHLFEVSHSGNSSWSVWMFAVILQEGESKISKPFWTVPSLGFSVFHWVPARCRLSGIQRTGRCCTSSYRA